MDRADVERIARGALKELGVSRSEHATVSPEDQNHWRIEYDTASGPQRLRIRCGQGTTPQWVREQIFQQYLQQS